MKSLDLHLVSDSSGETVSSVARACQVQFEDVDVRHHQWWLIRTRGQATRVLDAIAAAPGPVLYTVMDPAIRAVLEEGFARIEIPYIPILDPVLSTLSAVLDLPVRGKPGRQHVMDADYFRRIEAMQFTIDHDDGQVIDGLEEADVVVFGVSRTSKTPTCMYLANRGLKAANVPVVPGIPLPDSLLTLQGPLKIGLTREPRSLSDIRRNRLRMMNQSDEAAYADEELVREEVLDARRLFSRLGFPVIDVTRKSIEEAAAAILQLHNDHKRRQRDEAAALEDLAGYPT